MRSYPAYDHRAILRMPWRTFLALAAEIEAHEQRQRDAQYFKQRGLQREWDENREEWLRLQPPPPNGA